MRNKPPSSEKDRSASPSKRFSSDKGYIGQASPSAQPTPKSSAPPQTHKPKAKTSKNKASPQPSNTLPEKVRLVRYIALAGIAPRREAAKLIKNGQVSVNGQTVYEPWIYVDIGKDEVAYRGQTIRPEKPVYILLNKPKNTICTLKDEKGRRTVMDLLVGAPPVRLYPVGRLDRNTTGILLLTNDGALTQKLLHPKSKVPRTYRVTTVKPMNDTVLQRLLDGIPLPDGVAKADAVELEDPYTLIITLHIGRKHIVKRMLEYLGYRVKALDRIAFGPITRKGVPRGKWRFLTPQEVAWLKMLPDPQKSQNN